MCERALVERYKWTKAVSSAVQHLSKAEAQVEKLFALSQVGCNMV